ncbi:MAG TPA: hypothetical protein VFY49_01985 [Myxococcota bacterium]|nr:hypothetical protein [Myxococcota bacterium]
MQRIASSLAAVCAAALLAPAAFAQMTGGGVVSDSQFETIVSVSPDASAMIVQDAAGQQRTVILGPGTSIERQGRPGTAATQIRVGEIGVGDRILVTGAPRQGGFTAQRVQVFPPGVVTTPPAGVVTPPVGSPANPASPPGGVGAPDSANPASPPPGSVRPGDPNVAAPGGSPANPASPPGSGGVSNPAAPPPGGAGGISNPAAPPPAGGGAASP